MPCPAGGERHKKIVIFSNIVWSILCRDGRWKFGKWMGSPEQALAREQEKKVAAEHEIWNQLPQPARLCALVPWFEPIPGLIPFLVQAANRLDLHSDLVCVSTSRDYDRSHTNTYCTHTHAHSHSFCVVWVSGLKWVESILHMRQVLLFRVT